MTKSIFQADWKNFSQDQVLRVKIARVNLRAFLAYTYGQNHVPQYVEIPKSCLPDDCLILSIWVESGPLTIEVMVSHPSFDIVPLGEMPPRIDADVLWMSYALATQDEVNSRYARMDASPVAEPVKTWREQPPMI